MAENLSFGLSLDDQVSGPAKRAADAMRKVEEQARKSQKALDFSKELGRASEKLARIKFDPEGYKALGRVQKDLIDQRRKLLGLSSKVPAHGHGEGFSVLKMVESLGLAELAIGAAEKFVDIIKDGVKEAFNAAAKEEKLKLSYTQMMGKERGEYALKDADRVAKNTAYTGTEVAEHMRPLYMAGLHGKSARSAYAMAGDLAVMKGGGAEDVSQGVAFLSHIKTKGGINPKALANLGLGESGVVEFSKALGKKLHISSAAALKKASTPGGVDPQMILNMIGEAIKKTQHGELGTGQKKESETFGARMHKLQNLPEEYFKKLVDAPGFKKMSTALENVLKKLDPSSPLGKKILGSLVAAFEKLASTVDKWLKPENIDKFAAGITKIIDSLDGIPDLFDKIVTALEVMGTIWTGSKIVGMLEMFGGLTPVLAALSAPILAVAAAFGSIAFAIYRINDAMKELGGWDKVKDDLNEFVNGKAAMATGAHFAPKDESVEALQKKARPDLTLIENKPSAKSGSGNTKNVHSTVNSVIHIHPAKNDTAHSERETVKHLERAVQGAGAQ